eukprot:gene17428-23729_t
MSHLGVAGGAEPGAEAGGAEMRGIMVVTRSQSQDANAAGSRESTDNNRSGALTGIEADAGVKNAARSAAMNSAPRSRKGRKPPDAPGSSLAKELEIYENLPDYLKDNEFIKKYYRSNLALKESLWSLFKWHNETGAVWTHLIGFLLFLILTVYISQLPPTPLAFGLPQTNTLWLQMRGNVHQLRGRLSEMPIPHIPHSMKEVSSGLHKFQGSLQEGVHQLQDGVQSSIHLVKDTVHALGDQLQHRAHALQDGASHALQDGVHALQDGVHALQDGVHNRLGNITEALTHTHLYEALSASGRLQWPTERWPFYVFMAGAMCCLLLSSACHLLGCCKAHIATYVWRVDYAGIVVLVVTSFYPAVYYGFLCEPFWCMFYLIMISSFGACGIAVSLMECFQEPKWRVFRASMFAGLGLYGIVPVAHQWWINSHVFHVRVALMYDLVMGVAYLTGAAVYALRIPERWLPGKFDLILNSHQIFHVAVVAACILHYNSVAVMLEWRDASGGCAVPVMSGWAPQVIQEMEDRGHSLLSIDQVWEYLKQYASEYLASDESLVDEGVCPAVY